jgi:tetratricopeptide (TPR) repeat protein
MIALLLAAALTGPQLYEAGRYDQAAEAFAAAGQHYNAGNAHYKAGRLGRAIASYSRAHEESPRDPDARYNLSFALRRAGEDLVPAGVPSLLYGLFKSLSEREAAGLFWLAWWAALLLGCLRLLRVPAPGLGAACAALLASGLWWAALRLASPAAPGVVVVSAAEVRSGPGEKFPVSFTAPEGRRLTVLERSGEWLEIGVLKEGARGWTRASNIETY